MSLHTLGKSCATMLMWNRIMGAMYDIIVKRFAACKSIVDVLLAECYTALVLSSQYKASQPECNVKMYAMETVCRSTLLS